MEVLNNKLVLNLSRSSKMLYTLLSLKHLKDSYDWYNRPNDPRDPHVYLKHLGELEC